MRRSRGRPRARLQLPPLDAAQALALVQLCERLIAAVWRAHGEAMVLHGEAALDAKANKLPPPPCQPPPTPRSDDDCF